MYKDPKAYKSFETTWFTILMHLKMHIRIFLFLLIIYILAPLIYLFIFQKSYLTSFFQYLFSLPFSVHTYIYMFSLLFLHIFHLYIYSLAIWLLYPVLVKHFKKQAARMMQDEHVRGTMLVSDEELAEMVWEDIKNAVGWRDLIW